MVESVYWRPERAKSVELICAEARLDTPFSGKDDSVGDRDKMRSGWWELSAINCNGSGRECGIWLFSDVSRGASATFESSPEAIL